MVPNQLILPFSNLTPDVILDAVESVGLRCSGSLLALNSYENRVYQVGIEEAVPIIVKFYRAERWSDEAILEEHQFAIELSQQEIPVVEPMIINGQTLYSYQDLRFALFTRQGGRHLELDNLDQLEWMGRFIGRIHAMGAKKAFQFRSQLTVETYGYQPYLFLIANQFIPDYLAFNFKQTVEMLLEKINICFMKASPMTGIRLHGDFHPGNVLWRETGPHIVDLDDTMMGPAVQDIWMLLSGDQNQQKQQLDYILAGYNEFFDFNYAELHLIEALRSLRMLHYMAWLAKRWEEPAFKQAFPWFNTPRYWQEQLQHLAEQNTQLNDLLIELE